MRTHSRSKILLAVCLFLFTGNVLNAVASEWKLRISVEKANVLREPNAESPVVSTALKGTILDSYEKIGEWFRIIIGPDDKGFIVIGYIHSSDVQVLKEKISKEPDFWKVESEFFRGIGLSVKLSGGLSYFGSGDIDRGTRGFFDSAADSLSTAGYLLDKRTNPFHSGIEVSGDIIYSISSRIGIGLGVDYIHATVNNVLIVTGKELPLGEQVNSKPEINAVPIRLGLFFKFPLHRLFSISLSCGPSLCLIEYSYSLYTIWEDMTSIFQGATAKSFGFHGGIGFEVNVNRRAVLFIEGLGRYAKISNFEGEETTQEFVFKEEKYFVSGYVTTKEKGKLYYMEDGQYPYLAIRKEEPSGFKNMRKATFDLSGVSLRAGLIIKF